MAENIESQMNFIIAQQAQFAVGIQKLQEAQVRLEASQERLQVSQERLQTWAEGVIRTLVDVNLSLVNHFQTFTEDTHRRFQDLIESQAHTDRRLDVLITVVDKLARRNGGAA